MKFTLILIAILFCFGCQEVLRKPKPENVAVEEVINKTKIVLEQKYHIRSLDSGASMPNGNVKRFFLDFEIRGPVSKEYLRRILIDSANRLLSQINNNDKVQQFLVKQPFKIEDVDIIIYNNSLTGEEVYDPEISIAEIIGGVLIFKTEEKSNPYGYENTYKETYEEALQKLQNAYHEE